MITHTVLWNLSYLPSILHLGKTLCEPPALVQMIDWLHSSISTVTDTSLIQSIYWVDQKLKNGH